MTLPQDGASIGRSVVLKIDLVSSKCGVLVRGLPLWAMNDSNEESGEILQLVGVLGLPVFAVLSVSSWLSQGGANHNVSGVLLDSYTV